MTNVDSNRPVPKRVSADRESVAARGETVYQGPSGIGLTSFPPKERWEEWVELDSRSWPKRVEKRYTLVPTTCFNCESACGLLAYIDPDTLDVRKFEGNPEHPASRGKNCAKGPATLNQITDPDRILFPLQRVGARGEGKWRRISWDDALDRVAARIRKAIQEERRNEIIYHVGRPGEDGYTERVMAAWGLDGHNSHTNICSSGARTGYHFWMGMDRPSPDFANAKTILLISAHLESGHYFNPHAQRITEGRTAGAKLIVMDVRLSNTATHADHWIAPYPGTEAAIVLAIVNWLLANDLHDRAFVERWWNWRDYLDHVGADISFEVFETKLKQLYAEYTFEFAARESGVDAAVIADIARMVADAGTALATHNWRSASAGNLHGWTISRALFMLNALTGAIATPGGTFPNTANKFVPRPIYTPPHPHVWNPLSWPIEYPLALHELSFLLPHFLKEGRGTIDTYFTRVYNPVWTNPDGFTWIEQLTDENKVGLHVALTPTWSETAFFADLILPMGLGSERHDIHSYETHDGQWIGFRQPVKRAARERISKQHVADTREVNPGEVWEENEFWIELSWRIDPDGSMGIRKFFESKAKPGEKLTVDEYYSFMFDNSVPGLPERAAQEGLTPLGFMRKYGAFEVAKNVGPIYAQPVDGAELDDTKTDTTGRVFTRAPKPAGPNIVPLPTPPGDADGRRLVGVDVDGSGVPLRGFPTPSGRLEFFSRTLHDWGWPELAIPTYAKSHIHPDNLRAGEMPLIPTFRIPIQIHTRSANAKWLDEIAHTNPLWLHPQQATALGVQTGDLVRVNTRSGHFVVKAWVTEGIRPGVVACSHHMGRWRLKGDATQTGQRQMMGMVDLTSRPSGMAFQAMSPASQPDAPSASHQAASADSKAAASKSNGGSRSANGGHGLEGHATTGHDWDLQRLHGAGPYASTDADTQRIWWTDIGVHQNLTFGVQPDPISGMHCWHQAVRIERAQPTDKHGDIHVDTAKSHELYREWLERTRPATKHSPDGTRRPYWLLRPLKPAKEVYTLPDRAP